MSNLAYPLPRYFGTTIREAGVRREWPRREQVGERKGKERGGDDINIVKVKWGPGKR